MTDQKISNISLELTCKTELENKIETYLEADSLISNGDLGDAEEKLLWLSNENPNNGFYNYLLGINYDIFLLNLI